jgi:hypothetical protein
MGIRRSSFDAPIRRSGKIRSTIGERQRAPL